MQAMRQNRVGRRIWPLLLLFVATVAWAGAEIMSVQVRSGQLRDKPSFLGKIGAPVSYGDRLTVMETRGAWVRVQGAGTSGWIHSSALTTRKLELKSGSDDLNAGASAGELALAGKGFNDEVETKYRADHPEADFTWIDKMESVTISPEQAIEFLQAGGITDSTGGAQ